jgi:hypothetical protein
MPKRELIDTGTDQRHVRRDGKGQFKKSDDVERSLAADRRQKAKTKVKPGYGDRGDKVGEEPENSAAEARVGDAADLGHQ